MVSEDIRITRTEAKANPGAPTRLADKQVTVAEDVERKESKEIKSSLRRYKGFKAHQGTVDQRYDMHSIFSFHKLFIQYCLL